jgi:transcriptional regulator with XRE-family HTH domain
LNGNLVKQWRMYEGWTVERFVEEIYKQTGKKIGLATIKRWEGGRHEPHSTNLLLLAESLGVDYQTFLKGPDQYSSAQENSSTPETIANRQDIFIELYSFRGVKKSLQLSRWIGFSYPKIPPRLSKEDYFLLYIDKENSYIRFGEIVACLLDEGPEEGNLILVWNPEAGPQIQEFSRDFPPSPHDIIHGVILSELD